MLLRGVPATSLELAQAGPYKPQARLPSVLATCYAYGELAGQDSHEVKANSSRAGGFKGTLGQASEVGRG